MIDRAIQYIKNTGGNATLADFVEDHEPVGQKLWEDLVQKGMVEIVNGKVAVKDTDMQTN